MDIQCQYIWLNGALPAAAQGYKEDGPGVAYRAVPRELCDLCSIAGCWRLTWAL